MYSLVKLCTKNYENRSILNLVKVKANKISGTFLFGRGVYLQFRLDAYVS